MEKELKLMAECVIWMHNSRPDLRGKFRRVKNETDHMGGTVRSRIAQGVENKATGVYKGTWDGFLITKPILWIEFKVGSNSLTPEQRDFLLCGNAVGWQFRIIRSLEDFQILIKEQYGQYSKPLDGKE